MNAWFQNRFILLLLTLLVLLAPRLVWSDVVDKIKALVDDQVITQSDLNEAKSNASKFFASIKDPKELQQIKQSPTYFILQRLVNQKVLEQEIKKQDIKISDDEINGAINSMLSHRQINLATFQQSLKNEGISLQDYKEKVREDLQYNQFLQKIIYPRIHISDHELQEYYNNHKKEFQGYSKIRFLEIFLTPESIPANQKFETFARNLVSQLQKGASFSNFSKQYSRGAFAKNGGDSGLIEIDSLRIDLARLLSMLPINVVSDPIASPDGDGVFIFKIIDKRDPIDRPFNDVKELIRQRYGEEVVKQELEEYLMEARSRHFVEIRQDS